MPKILVLFDNRSSETGSLAEALADGARSIRFSEVELRRIDDFAEELATFDAIVLGAADLGAGMPPRLAELLGEADQLGLKGALKNKVGAAFTTAPALSGGAENSLAPVLSRMARQGMILVPADHSVAVKPDDAAAAVHLGKRVAEVTAWVTHAKSHHHH